MKKSIYKVPNGKLLKIALEEKNGSIEQVKITGDFFLYPEENLSALEEKLKGSAVNREELVKRVEEFQKATGTQFFGLDGEAIAHAILLASQAEI